MTSRCQSNRSKLLPFLTLLIVNLSVTLSFQLSFLQPHSDTHDAFGSNSTGSIAKERVSNLEYVDPHIGTNGPDPSEYGGMVPSVSAPFASVRWTPMTRENKVSGCAYHFNDTNYIGAIGSRQPAIWMGDYGFSTIFPGWSKAADGSKIAVDFQERGLPFLREDENASAYKHEVTVNRDVKGQSIFIEMSAKSRSAMIQYTYEPQRTTASVPHIVVQATRSGWRGAIYIDPDQGEISGYNPERMDYRLGPHQAPAFKGFFVYRFEYQTSSQAEEGWVKTLKDYGTISTNSSGSLEHSQQRSRWNEDGLFAYVRFPADTVKVRVRVGMSLISIDQARYNLEEEIKDGTMMGQVVEEVREAWRNKIDRVRVEGGTLAQKRILYTGIYHALQYPSEHAEPIPSDTSVSDRSAPSFHYYSAYTDSVHVVPAGEGWQRYQSWSIWDTFRAQWGFLILFEPERVLDMVRSLLDIYSQSGWLPMWANLAETNIMIGTHADSLIAEALRKGIRGFNESLAWEAVKKDATVPPDREDELRFEDREEFTPAEVRAGLSAYREIGFVPLDGWSESTSRTLDYAYDDHSVSRVASHLGLREDSEFYSNRSLNYVNVFDSSKGLMGARFRNGTFLDQPLEDPKGRQEGFTEGNMWDYTFGVIHDVRGLSKLVGGQDKLVDLLDRHFSEGHNDQSNEPSHHIPYLYSLLGKPWKTQERVRKVALEAFRDQPDGYAGNEDCGQQSSWYFFTSALGCYPVDPVSGEYVVGSPFFERVEVDLPARSLVDGREEASGRDEQIKTKRLVIKAEGASDKPFVRGLKVEGRKISEPLVTFEDIVSGGEWEFEMSSQPESWDSS
ncbi:hypothetical protein IE53DRAFT_365775 [Violaceomyces palustris]|uniref:Uncharacterized protein n=1 Tax=Violaceomyces palustris TaxID=1673888 RepID=A0ACD0P7S8_9BASI|nr:hypothetical protein IE53DRAFT_365775 [Violaceomyces palustris]